MFILRKVFQLRDLANPESEKPFLEHLEDLRIAIGRCLGVLMITTIICFTFQSRLMALLRMPIDKVMHDHLEQTLNKVISAEDWQKALEVDAASATLNEPERHSFYEHLEPKVAYNAELVRLTRAAKVLPTQEQRTTFLKGAANEETVAAVQKLIDANAEISIRNGVESRQMMSSLSPTETFMLSMKLSFFAGVVLAFPFLMLFILQFVVPGLHDHERKMLWPALAVGFGLFLIGVVFAYVIILPKSLDFFFEWGRKMGVANEWRIGEYISFATKFTLLFGLSFELPVIVMVGVKLGLLNYELMRRTRSYAILAIVIAAVLICPSPDAATACLMAGPMIVLYEVCIWLAWFDERKRARVQAEEELHRSEEDRERINRLRLELEQAEATDKDRKDIADHAHREEEEKRHEDDGPPDFRGD